MHSVRSRLRRPCRPADVRSSAMSRVGVYVSLLRTMSRRVFPATWNMRRRSREQPSITAETLAKCAKKERELRKTAQHPHSSKAARFRYEVNR